MERVGCRNCRSKRLKFNPPQIPASIAFRRLHNCYISAEHVGCRCKRPSRIIPLRKVGTQHRKQIANLAIEHINERTGRD